MPEPEKLFTVYVNCEGPEFQGRGFTSAMLDILQTINGGIKTGKWAGPIMSRDGETTIGNWNTRWRNDDPADRQPPKRKKSPNP